MGSDVNGGHSEACDGGFGSLDSDSEAVPEFVESHSCH